MQPQPQKTRIDQLKQTFWARHSNPWSGWSRTLGHPALVAALYHRSWRGVAACIGYFIINPLLFPPPKNTDNWMSQGVLGERLWTSGYNPRRLASSAVPVVPGSSQSSRSRSGCSAAAHCGHCGHVAQWMMDRAGLCCSWQAGNARWLTVCVVAHFCQLYNRFHCLTLL